MNKKEKTYALLLKANDQRAIVEFKGKEEGLDFYYNMINCDCIDIVNTIFDGYQLIVDDEGRLKENPQVNIVASVVYGILEHGEMIVGDALLCARKSTLDGVETVGFSLEEAEKLMKVLCLPSTATEN